MMRIKISGYTELGVDTFDISKWGLHLIKSPDNMGSDIKESNIQKIDYPEKDGDDIYVSTTPKQKSFNYSVTFGFYDGSLNSANSKIVAFYNLIQGKEVTIYNDYKLHKIVGYVTSYKSGEFYRGAKDVVLFDLTFYVPKVALCDFNITP